MKKYVIITINEQFSFVGKYLKEKERPNWHYYETSEGSIIHFRKEHMVSVREDNL